MNRPISMGYTRLDNSVCFTESAWFDRLTLTIVLLNCVDLAVLGPPSQPHASYHDSFEMFTTYYFTVELLCKVIAMGFAGHAHARIPPALRSVVGARGRRRMTRGPAAPTRPPAEKVPPKDQKVMPK